MSESYLGLSAFGIFGGMWALFLVNYARSKREMVRNIFKCKHINLMRHRGREVSQLVAVQSRRSWKRVVPHDKLFCL